MAGVRGDTRRVLRRPQRRLCSDLRLGQAPIANAREGSLADLFFFSVETTSTVGYGDMHPQTIFGHVVATAENFTGLLLLAVMTGLVFARFSRPRARIVFAKYPVVTQYNGETTLIFRMANARSNFITEATAKLWTLSRPSPRRASGWSASSACGSSGRKTRPSP